MADQDSGDSRAAGTFRDFASSGPKLDFFHNVHLAAHRNKNRELILGAGGSPQRLGAMMTLNKVRACGGGRVRRMDDGLIEGELPVSKLDCSSTLTFVARASDTLITTVTRKARNHLEKSPIEHQE